MVANEVKELAKQTAASTEQITNIVVGIQQGTTESASAIEAIQEIVREIATNQTAAAASVEQQANVTSRMNAKVGAVKDSIGVLSNRSVGLRENSAVLTSLVVESAARGQELTSVTDDLARLGGCSSMN